METFTDEEVDSRADPGKKIEVYVLPSYILPLYVLTVSCPPHSQPQL